MSKVQTSKSKVQSDNLKLKSFFLFYFLTLVALFLYSFTQVDLNLTLTKIDFWFAFQDFFQYIGYFKRPLSTFLYLSILLLLFTFYFLLLHLTAERKIEERQILYLIGITVVTLLLSYPAFSYDIFNYMFDAKVVVVYQRSPYQVKPLDFQGIDPWLNFLHWTHRPSIFPPLWIALTTIPYFLGFGKFLLILWNFKILIASAYLGSVYFLGKILERISPQQKLSGLVFFAFNPLVIIESLVSAHLDMMMIFFALISLYYLILKRRVLALWFLSLSVGIKYVTLALLPLIFFGFRRFWVILLMTFSLILVISKIEIQPWYFLWVLPFIAITYDKKWILWPAIGLSFGLLLRYTPFLYYGHWNEPVPTIKFWVTVILLFLFSFGWGVFFIIRHLKQRENKI